MDRHVALLPAPVADAQPLAGARQVEELVDVAEVVAQLPLARQPDIIHVEVARGAHDAVDDADLAQRHGEGALGGPGVAVADVDGLLAAGVVPLHVVVGVLVDEAVCERVVAVRAVLDGGVGETVADGKALHRDVHRHGAVGGGVPDGVGDRRDVVPGIRLAGDEKVAALELRVGLEELLQEVQHVAGDLHLVVHAVLVRVAVGEAGADGLVHKDHGVLHVPAVGRLGQRHVLVHVPGAVLYEHRQLRGAARPAGHPQHHGVVCLHGARLEQEVEHVSVGGAIQLEEARQPRGPLALPGTPRRRAGLQPRRRGHRRFRQTGGNLRRGSGDGGAAGGR
mmetsp:Transcript_32837/g.83924  ORF Transcript_32837/g.83924 Transcript_32837/m.83924 type:complete len:337 (-) Transcript_32837:330-1340(-)